MDGMSGNTERAVPDPSEQTLHQPLVRQGGSVCPMSLSKAVVSDES